MAPIEADISNSNIRPIGLFASYLAAASGLTFFVSRNILFKAFKSLPPSQATRIRTTNRRKHVILFTSLAVVSLIVTIWQMFRVLSLSYRAWAYEMGQSLPQSWVGEGGVWGEGKTGLALGRWLEDTDLLNDALEIAVEKSRRYWWTQQLILAAAAWSIYLSVEGRRRNIRHLWAFMLLAQTVGLSFAINLFFVAVLLTSVPLAPRENESESPRAVVKQRQKKSAFSDTSTSTLTQKTTDIVLSAWTRVRPFLPPSPTKPHHHTWEPHALALFAPVLVSCICAFLLPYATGTELFFPLHLVSCLALLQPLYPQFFMPESFGSTSPTHSHVYLPRLISAVSFALHIKQSLVALLDADPGAYSHRHSHYLAYAHLPHEEERTKAYRSATAFGGVLGAFDDHPVVSLVGWDVLMCGLSLGLWAAIRGIHPGRILSAVGLGTELPKSTKKPAPRKRGNGSAKTAAAKEDDTTGTITKTPAKSTRRRKKSTKSEGADDTIDAAAEFKPPPSAEIDDMAFEGEEDLPENFESAALDWGLFALGGLGVSAVGALES